MSSTVFYKDIIAFHPGAYIEDIIDDLNITQSEFAKRMNTSSKTISTLVRGKSKLTPDLAFRLADLSGIDAGTWLSLQHEYDLKMLKIEEAREKGSLE